MDAHPGMLRHARQRVVRRRCAGLGALAVSLAACAGESASPPRAEPPPYPLADRITIDVTADDYRWHLAYAGPDGELGTPDDVRAMRDVHVPEGTQTVLRLHSRDFVYKLRLPHLGMAEIAVPEQEFTLAFDSGPPGEHELRGDQFCGFTHPELIGTLHVLTEDAFHGWLAEQAARGAQEEAAAW